MKYVFWGVYLWIVGWSVDTFAQKNKRLTIKVMSYHINHGINENDQTNLTRVAELIKNHKPHLVALQDLDSGVVRTGRLHQLRILSLLTGYDFVFDKATEGNGEKNGLGILSKFPIEARQRLPLPNPENTPTRILQCALVALPNNQYLRFCNTELDDFSPLNRGLQAAVVNEALQYSIQPVILAGNFNVQPLDHSLEALTKYWNDAGEKTIGGTYPITGKRIDYIWTLKNAKLKLKDYTVLYEPFTSEHYPVLAIYSLEK
ncbi:MAG: endonuclease/exonuclease/phosphatase family protein [Runella sp.]